MFIALLVTDGPNKLKSTSEMAISNNIEILQSTNRTSPVEYYFVTARAPALPLSCIPGLRPSQQHLK